MLKRTFIKRPALEEDFSLQITSMADIFTIILIFLLKSFATGQFAFSPSKGITLPMAAGSAAFSEALKVEVSSAAVLIEGRSITQTPQALAKAFRHERKRQDLIVSKNPGVSRDARILIVADQEVPYSSLQTVLSSAASQGYTDFKLAVAGRN
ncbi:biopolymer transporter ExbD [Bdellovibrionota bacterium FG-2]